MQDSRESERSGRAWWYLLLVIPYIALLWVPFYNSTYPDLAGIPFFYWYQFLCVPISGILTAIVYFATESRGLRGVDGTMDNVRRMTRD